MSHWDEIIALKERIGIDDSFRPTIIILCVRMQ